MGSLRMVIE